VFLCMYGIDSKDVGLHKGHVTYQGKRPVVLHLNNGATRVKWFPSVVRSVLHGQGFGPTARKIVYDTVWTSVRGWVILAVVLLLVWLGARALKLSWKQGIL